MSWLPTSMIKSPSDRCSNTTPGAWVINAFGNLTLSVGTVSARRVPCLGRSGELAGFLANGALPSGVCAHGCPSRWRLSIRYNVIRDARPHADAMQHQITGSHSVTWVFAVSMETAASIAVARGTTP